MFDEQNPRDQEDMDSAPLQGSDEENPAEMARKRENAGFRDELFDWAQNIAIILTVVGLVFIFAFRIIGVEGESMVPTLHDQDWMVISKLFYEPKQGDIVVLTKKEFMEQPIVKRIIATEGQLVDINFETGEVTVDGQVLDEPYIAEKTHRQFDMQFPARVPENCVFVMGDNRNRSSDSRVSKLGMVNEQYILGKLLIRIFPFNRFGTVD